MITKEEPVCEICRHAINKLSEDWSLIIDYRGKKKINEICLHKICFREKFKTLLALDRLGKKILGANER